MSLSAVVGPVDPNLSKRRKSGRNNELETIRERAATFNLNMPDPASPGGNYRSFMWSGSQLWIAGQLPRTGDDVRYTGAVGADLTIEEGRAAARLCALNTLAVVDEAVGGEWRSLRCLSITGFVRCAPEFGAQAQVIDGASETLLCVLGKNGQHVRTAVGVHALPRGVPVEIASIWERVAASDI